MSPGGHANFLRVCRFARIFARSAVTRRELLASNEVMKSAPASNASLVRPELGTDEQLVDLVLGGDVDSFAVLMRRHNQRLYRVVRGFVGDASTAEDILQQTYVLAYRGLAQFERRAKFSTWLTRIAVREALRTRRRAARVEEVHERANLVRVIELTRSPEDHAAIKEWTRALERAIDELPEEYRTVLVLRRVEQMDTDETAALLGLSPENVRVRLHRARALLKEVLFQRVGDSLDEVYEFGGKRCDGIVARVLAELSL